MHICLSHCLPALPFSIQRWPIAPCHTILHLSGLKSNYHFNLLSAFVHAWVYPRLTQVPAAAAAAAPRASAYRRWWSSGQWGPCIRINEGWIHNEALIMMQHLKHRGRLLDDFFFTPNLIFFFFFLFQHKWSVWISYFIFTLERQLQQFSFSLFFYKCWIMFENWEIFQSLNVKFDEVFAWLCNKLAAGVCVCQEWDDCMHKGWLRFNLMTH